MLIVDSFLSLETFSHWAEMVAQLVTNKRAIVYLDFVDDTVQLSMKLREEHGIEASSFYGRGLSGHDKDELLKN